jgi:1-acyl-sn-glycerol-3-phosphate acyltransferase
MIAWFRAVLGYLVFFFLIAPPAALHIYAMWLACNILGIPAARRRAFAGSWLSWWGMVTHRVSFWCLGVTTNFENPISGRFILGAPAIVIVNHRKTLDTLVVMALLRHIGITQVRWVMKNQLRNGAFFIGHACAMMEAAFVGRTGSKDDIENIIRCAEKAKTDRASMVIFPEGTRFTEARRIAGFRHVLAPKVGGFLALRKVLPTDPILSVTIHWEDKDGREMFDSHKIVGMRLRVSSRYIAPDEAARTGFLEEEWHRKDDELAANTRPK